MKTEAEALEEGLQASTEAGSFVEYVAPPKPSVRRPPKYKAWIVILVLVYLTRWALELSDFFPWLGETGRLSTNTLIVLQLCLVVFVLMYAGVDVVAHFLRIRVRGEWYGLGRWMSDTSRVQWVHEYNNIVVETIGVVISVLEDGFGMFDVPSQGTTVSSEKPCQYDCPDANGQVVLKIEYKIRKDKVVQYRAWRRELKRAMAFSSRPGLLRSDRNADRDEDDPSITQRVYLTFSSIDYLNEYMTSPVRERLMRRLQPLLQHNSEVTQAIQQNAFADLAGLQGCDVPTRQPPKWKVWWITVLSYYGSTLFLNSAMPFYFERWSQIFLHDRLQSLVLVFLTTFSSSYMVTPFLTMTFAHWMQAKSAKISTHEPWRTLDEGIQSIALKTLFLVAFFGSCIVSWQWGKRM